MQRRIDSYFTTYHDNTRFARIKSERLKNAVAAITGQTAPQLNESNNVQRKRKSNNSRNQSASNGNMIGDAIHEEYVVSAVSTTDDAMSKVINRRGTKQRSSKKSKC